MVMEHIKPSSVLYLIQTSKRFFCFTHVCFLKEIILPSVET